jgi:uncharacterized protein with HEPN domain
MKDDPTNLEDVRIAANKVQAFISNVSHDKFLKNDLVQSAVIRQLEIMGEAVKRFHRSFARIIHRSHGNGSPACVTD